MEISILWFFLGIITATAVIIPSYYLYRFLREYYYSHYKIATYADVALTMRNNAIHINCINVNKYPELWNSHESDLELYAMGNLIPTVFFKSPDVPNGFKIAYSSTLTNQQVLSLMAAIKYNRFEISNDSGENRVAIKSISDKRVKAITQKLQKLNAKVDTIQRDEVLSKIKDSVKYDFIGNDIANDRIVSHVDEDKSSSNFLRYQAIIHDEHEVFNKGFAPEATKFYYVYYGKLYEFKTRFVSKIENLYEWELYDLEPNSIYVGFSHSVDGGKTILPSTSLYGITKTEDGVLHDVSNSNLGKPKEDQKGFKLWTFDEAKGYMDESLTKKTIDVIVKKHYEDENPEAYIGIQRVDQVYDHYDWLPCSLEDFNKDKL